jgi:hypothetical protein
MAQQFKQNGKKKPFKPFVKYLQGRDVAVCISTANGKSTFLKGQLHQATAKYLILWDVQKKSTIIAIDKLLYAKEM